ncbi:MAG: hypothetical protein KDE28_30355, partial [Anaerolineales bacterium]|nr:hypothetical protein [Anaerolineales bacterium]
RVAATLGLSVQDADRLIQATGYPALPTLYRETADEVSRSLFQLWLPFKVPFEPPPLPAVYVGRLDAEAQLSEHFREQKIKRQVIWGMAGVGKSSLAIRAAHLLKPEFPDGVLWLQLDQLTSLAALGHIAASFGDDVSDRPDLASRSAHVRSLLANKRALLIYDNVTAESQLTPLLPADECPCAVLVTTRRALSHFNGAQTLSLNPFSPEDDAFELLFARTLPATQFGLFKPVLAEMAALLGYLPLALAIIAARIKLTPHLQPEILLERLRQETERLSTLQQGNNSVAASFNVSFALLKPAQQSLFAQLGRLGRAEFGRELVVAMSGLTPYAVDDVLSDLYQLSFLHRGRQQRYQLHPLLHDFARAQAAPDQTLPRLLAYYLHFLTIHSFAYQQIDNEVAHIREVGAAAQAAGRRGDHAVLVSRMLPYYLQRGEHQLAQGLIDESWADYPDEVTLARLWLNQGALATLEGRFADALKAFAQATVIVDPLDNSEALLRAQIYWHRAQCQHLAGNVQPAYTDYQQAFVLAEQAQATPLQTRIMAHMAVNQLAVTQDYAAVIALLQRGLHLARQDRDVEAELPLLVSLGSAYFEQGQWELALATYHEGQQLAFTTGRTLDNIKLHNNTANVLMEQGAWAEAGRYLDVALRLSEAIGSLEIRLRLLTSLGALQMRRHEWAES